MAGVKAGMLSLGIKRILNNSNMYASGFAFLKKYSMKLCPQVGLWWINLKSVILEARRPNSRAFNKGIIQGII